MPVSKKRKKKRVSPTPPPPKGGHQPKPKITRQRLILYIISAIMIISLAASFVVRSTGRSTAVQQTQAVDSNNPLTAPASVEATQDSPTPAGQDSATTEAPSDGGTNSEGESAN